MPTLPLPLARALAATALLLATIACEEGDAGTLTGTSNADAIAGDQGLRAADAATETANGTADSAPDVVEDIEPAADAVVETIAEIIAEVADTTPETVAEVAAADAKPETVAETSDPCATKLAQFTKLKNSALSCKEFYECHKLATASANCTDCSLWHNGLSIDTQNLNDYTPEWKKSGCAKACPAPCTNTTTEIGICTNGLCETAARTCKELDDAAAKALATGAKCSVDADCTFKVSNTLGCGCATFVNVKTMGPGKPLFLYMSMLVKAYKAKTCTSEVACACPDPQSAKCVAGVCIAQ